jgi:GTP-binding protein LepA
MDRLQINDSSFTFEPESSDALGFGFRCGFLGLLHMEIIQERLEREYNLDLITTAPSVVYFAHTKNGETVRVDNPSKMPPVGEIDTIEEPILKLTVHVPAEYVGPVVALCEERRGTQLGINYATKDHVVVTYELPLAEVILDFHDRLKSASRGYASMDYEVTGYRADSLVKLDLMLNGEPLDALSIIVHKDTAYSRGRALAAKLKELVPRQQ